MPTANEQQAKPRMSWIAGVILGPVFYVVVLLQMAFRSGFSIRIHPISLLELGSAGWIQSVNFAITGVLGLIFATGFMFRPKSGLLASLFIAFAIGALVVAVFPPDPFMGFPPGSSTSADMRLSTSAKMHGVGFLVMFGPLIIACVAVALRSYRTGPWGLYVASIVAGVTIPIVLTTGMAVETLNSEMFFLLGVVAFGWVSVFAGYLIKENAA